MTVTIHQPEHLPWLGFFHKAAQAEVLVLLDNVQYRHKYFQNRNRIRTAAGESWLNVPVLLKGYGRPLLNHVRINTTDVRWREKCWRSICFNYSRSKFFDEHAPFFEGIYRRTWDKLLPLNLELLRYILGALGIKAKLVRASELGVTGDGPELILEILTSVGADEYISGISGIAGRGKDSEPLFRSQSIQVIYQNFHHPIYRQLHEPFLPCMSVIDLLFNYGPESMQVINGVGVPTLDTVFE